MKNRYPIVLLFLVISLVIGAQTSERIYPVDFKSCDHEDNTWPASLLWDNVITLDNKWCCFHAGYETPQQHWVVMDFGQEYKIDTINVYNEGYAGDHIFNTEDFSIHLSTSSMDGPWELLEDIIDNKENINTITAYGKTARYVKFLITDNEVIGEPNAANHDYACRVLELKVKAFVDASSAPAPQPSQSITRVPPSPFTPTQEQKTQPVRKPTESLSFFQEKKQSQSSQIDSTTPATEYKPTRQNSVQIVQPGATPKRPSTQTQDKSVATKGILYYFYSPEVILSIQLYNNVLGSTSVLPYATQYKVVPMNYKTDLATFQKHLVLRIPTIIIADQQGKELRRHTGSFTEQEIISFLSK